MMQIAMNTLGGLALFMLAMMMMTEGLKVFAGGGLKQLLNRYTSTPMRGVMAGVLVTGLVQSSGAVTVATIGFVNAGVFTLAQALTVVFGTNIGTTVTAWLVSLVGFGFKIENFALPILALGVLLRLGLFDRRLRGLGEALAGFGLFFLGLAILKDGFGGLAQSYSATLMDGERGGTLLFLILGFVATVLTQSSSASIAIVLTAVSGGVVGMYPAAVAIIGANLGSTSTAAMAVLRATPNAKRLALGHILFNLITGVVALALLPLLMWGIHLLADGLELEGSPAAVLALFHTVFNVLGVLLMLPAAGLLTRWLQRLFRSQEEEAGRPRHLDTTLTATPDLAESALAAELARLRLMASQMVHDALMRPEQPAALVEQQAAAMRTLVAAITDFISKVRAESMSREVGESLARDLRIARYLDEAARLSGNAVELRRQMAISSDRQVVDRLEHLIAAVKFCCDLTGRDEEFQGTDAHRQQALERFQGAYQQAKGEILAAAVARRLLVEQADQLLGVLSTTRRMVEQLVKADRLLRDPARAQVIEAQSEEASSPE